MSRHADPDPSGLPSPLSRRRFLAAGAAAGGLVAVGLPSGVAAAVTAPGAVETPTGTT